MSLNSTSPAYLQRRGAIDGVIGRMKRALSLAELSDVQFAVGRDHGQEKIFHAHKIFLSLSSDVFHAMFFGNLADNNQDIIQIPEIPSAAFANMLSYIYENAVDDLNWQNVFPTLYCADKYDLPWLAEICCVYLQVELNTENCLIALENINVWGPNFDSIVEACLDLIDASDGAVFQSEYFTGLSHGTLQMVVQRPTLAAPEYIIYTAVEAWAVEACKRKNVDPSTTNRREILGAVLFLVRFPLLTDAELASGPLKNALLLPAELWDIFMYKHNNENLVLSFDCEPRSYVQYRVGEAVFKHNEMVFAQGVDDVWYPAEVIGVSEQNVRIRWMRKMNNWWPFMSPQYIIRAADILQRGQRLHILVSGVPSAVSYCYRRAGLHVVEVDGREMSVKTEDLLLRQDEVIAWKAANKEEVNC